MIADDIQAWNRVVQAPIRFTLLSLLNTYDVISFGDVRHAMDVPAATLSRQVSILEHEGFVTVEKVIEGRHTRTYLAATEHGRDAYQQQLDVMQRLTNVTGFSVAE